MKINKIIGLNIKLARKNAKLTQDELAEKINCGRTQLVNIENGTSGTSVERLFKIAKELNTDLPSLLNIEVSRCPTCGTILKPE